MRTWSLIATALLAAIPAQASAVECLEGLVEVAGWSATFERGVADIRIGLRNLGDRDIDMVKGIVTFANPFGDPIEPPLQLRPDTAIDAGSPGTIISDVFAASTPLLTLDKSHVNVTACVTGLVFADGELLQAQTGSNRASPVP